MNSETIQPVANATGSEPEVVPVVPVWLVVTMFVLLYLGAIYFEENGGWFSPKVYAPFRTEEELVKVNPAAGGIDGGRVYNKPTCVSCHQANGLGSPGQFPPLAGSEWVNEAEPGRVIRIVLNGLTGPLELKGQTYNGTMVPWGLPPPTGLTDEEIAAVLTYVRQNKDWGNNAPAVTPERVKAVREKIKDHAGPFTPDELLKIPPAE